MFISSSALPGPNWARAGKGDSLAAPSVSPGDTGVQATFSRRITTTATLRELSLPLGLIRRESVSHLTRRLERTLSRDPKLKRDLPRMRPGKSGLIPCKPRGSRRHRSPFAPQNWKSAAGTR